jgi:hypothetical protein
MSRKSAAAIPSGADGLHPHIHSMLEAGEAIVWAGRPEPRRLARWSLLGIAPFALAGLWMVGVLVLPPYARTDVLNGIGAAMWVTIVVFVGGRMITQPLHEIFVLTDRRIMMIDPRPPATGSTFSADGSRGWLIRHIRVFGSRGNGDIEFRTILNATNSPRPWRIRRIPRPLETAELIKSTLRLDLPIEDRTR